MPTNRMRPIHPGEILREEFAGPLNLDEQGLAAALHIPVEEIQKLLAEEKSLNAYTALRLARYFNTGAQFWLNLQTAYDLKIAEQEIGPRIQREISPLAA